MLGSAMLWPSIVFRGLARWAGSTMLMFSHVQTLYENENGEESEDPKPHFIKVLHLELVLSTYLGAVCIVSIFISNERYFTIHI